MRNLLILFLLLISINSVSAQAPEMADTMRTNGKIYVVVAVAAISILCMAIYLIRIDSRLRKLEQNNSK